MTIFVSECQKYPFKEILLMDLTIDSCQKGLTDIVKRMGSYCYIR